MPQKWRLSGTIRMVKAAGRINEWIGRRVWAPCSVGLALGTVTFARNASIDSKPYIRLHVALDNGLLTYCRVDEVIRDFDTSSPTRKNPHPEVGRKPPNRTAET